jgi:hypothetical protein
MIAALLACTGPDPAPKGSTPADSGARTTTPDTETTSTPTAPPTVSDLGWTLNPDVASVVETTWTQDGPGAVHVEYQLDGVWQSTPSFAADAGPQRQVVVGIPFDTVADWRVVADGADPVDGAPITTGPLPEGLPVPVVETSVPSKWLPEGHFLLGSLKQQGPGWTSYYPLDFWTYLLDRQGRYVWAKHTPRNDWTLFPQVSVTGDYLLWDQATYWSQLDNGAGSTVHETWLDREFDVVPTPGIHQAWVQEPDGTLAWPSRDHGGTEAIVEKAPGRSDETVIWSCSDDWPQGDGYNCHCNGMFYKADTDSFVLSFPLWGTVLEASRAGGTLWWAGNVGGGYAFDPADWPFDWEHGVSWTDADTLLMSSNHAYTTWAVEYRVDRAAGVVSKVWASDSGARVNDMGQAWRLSNGNTLHIVGDTGVIREVTADDEEVWRLRFPDQNLQGRGELVDDLYALVEPR